MPMPARARSRRSASRSSADPARARLRPPAPRPARAGGSRSGPRTLSGCIAPSRDSSGSALTTRTRSVGFDDPGLPLVAGEDRADAAPLGQAGDVGDHLMDHRQVHPPARPVAPVPVAGRGEPEDLAPALGPLQQRRHTTSEPRQHPDVRVGLDPRDRGERRPAQVAVLGVGEWLEDRVLRLPSLEPPGHLRSVRWPEHLAHAQARRLERSRGPGRTRSPVKTSSPPPRSTNSPSRLASDAPRSSTFASTTASVFFRSGRSAPPTSRPSRTSNGDFA